jgi:hypothetical protein
MSAFLTDDRPADLAADQAAILRVEARDAVRGLLRMALPTFREYLAAVEACEQAGLSALGEMVWDRYLKQSGGLGPHYSISDLRAELNTEEHGNAS